MPIGIIFIGEGNASRRMIEADHTKDTLHYKNGCSLPYETFLTKFQKMYNIFAIHREEILEDTKTRFLFKKIKHECLSNAFKAMKAKITTDPTGSLTYTTVYNHIVTAISELLDYITRSRTMSGIRKGGGVEMGQNILFSM